MRPVNVRIAIVGLAAANPETTADTPCVRLLLDDCLIRHSENLAHDSTRLPIRWTNEQEPTDRFAQLQDKQISLGKN